MANVTFVVHSEWLENIEKLPIEQQDKIIAEFVRYGCDMNLEHEDDSVIQAFVNMLKGRIDFSKDKYQQKVNNGKTSGRRKKVDDKNIRELARGGKSSSEIAQLLGISKSSVDHSEGWRRRNDDDGEFVF